MKNFLFILLLPIVCHAQKIAENKVDEFTHHKIKKTSWDELAYKFNGSMYAHTRISRIDSSLFLELKYICHTGCLVKEGDKLMFKMSNDSIITVKALSTTLGCTGCGSTGLVGYSSLGLDINYVLTDDQLKYLSENKITKIRFYMSDGYIEEEITPKDARHLSDQARLML